MSQPLKRTSKRFNTHLFVPFNPPQIVRVCCGIYDRTPQIRRFRCCSHVCCQLVVEPQIVQHTEPHTEPFVSLKQVTYIYARGNFFACGTTAALRYRPGIKFVFFGEQPHFAAPSEKHLPCCALRSGSTQKIHPAMNSLKDVQRRADTH